MFNQNKKRVYLMEFTPKEFEILKHRLEVPDAIAECLTDDNEELDSANIEDVANMILFNGRTSNPMTPIELMIVRDCCTGSTFFACLEGAIRDCKMERKDLYPYNRAAKTLEDKLGVDVVMA